jgi:hypothetical protein
MSSKKKSAQEEFKVSGEEMLKKIKKLIHEGNIRRIIIKSNKGDVLMEIPLTFAVVGTMLAPVMAAVGALTAVMTEYSIIVVKKE